MKNAKLKTMAVFIIIGACIATYVYLQQEKTKPKPQSIDIPQVKPATPLPEQAKPESR